MNSCYEHNWANVLSWYDCASFGYMTKSGIAVPWGRLIPNFLRNHYSDFQSGCTSMYFHQQWKSVLLTLHPLQHKLSLVFWLNPFWPVLNSISESLWFVFPWWLRMLNNFLSIFRPFVIFLLRFLCLDLYPHIYLFFFGFVFLFVLLLFSKTWFVCVTALAVLN